jgi:hypothetical protein
MPNFGHRTRTNAIFAATGKNGAILASGAFSLLRPLVAPTDTKVSTIPSSNSFAFTLDGIYASHPIEPDMRNGQLHLPKNRHVRSIVSAYRSRLAV